VIVVEGTLWPVVVLGAVDDAPRDALIVTEELLDMSDALAIGVIVAGTGELAVQGQYAALCWIENHQALLMSRALRLAWVIEDERIRACTDTWLRCMGQTLFTVQSMTFRTLQTALPWLIETPWPLRPATDWRDRVERRAQASGRSKKRTVHLVSRS
jgi:hypothetical protein